MVNLHNSVAVSIESFEQNITARNCFTHNKGFARHFLDLIELQYPVVASLAFIAKITIPNFSSSGFNLQILIIPKSV